VTVTKTKTESKSVTLQTIADRLGVSRTTVSNAYGRPNQLNPALREKILAAAKELGYAGPDPAARTLRRGQAGVLGVLFGESLAYAFSDPGAVLMFQGVAEAAEEAGVNLLLIAAPPGRPADPLPIREAVVDRFVTLCIPEDDPRLAAILERGLPTVEMDNERHQGIGWVGIDDFGGARQAAAHLIDLGHRRLAVVVDRVGLEVRNGPARPEDLAAPIYATNRQRLRGYADAVDAAGLCWADVQVWDTPGNTIEAGCVAAAALLDHSPRPTAILATTDQLAFGVLQAARQRGVRVPDQLSVVGFDDLPAAAAASPPLTTIRQSLVEKGRVAGRLALKSWPNGEPPAVALPIELVVRASTGPAPI
jgi:DNA-binding LacI/PurR family transcriptional regulator